MERRLFASKNTAEAYILPVLAAPGPLSVTSQRQYTPAAKQSQSSSSELFSGLIDSDAASKGMGGAYTDRGHGCT